MNISRTVLTLLLFSAPGCAGTTDLPETTEEEDPASEPVRSEKEELQATLDTYVRSLIDRDVAALAEVVSSEIHARSIDRGIGLETFLEEQRASMLRTFHLTESDRPAFEIAEVMPAGDRVIRAVLRLDGEPLKKDFYFVRDGEDFKLNIAKPGFSLALRGSSNYQVHNVNAGNGSVTMTCVPGNVTVSAGNTEKVRCQDNCDSWWSGTLFQRYEGDIQRVCDWNSWGDDVIINFLSVDGWDCNDYCP